MASEPLEPCPKCGKPVAENAATCPHCGHQFTSRGTVMVGVFLVGVLVLILLTAFLGNPN